MKAKKIVLFLAFIFSSFFMSGQITTSSLSGKVVNINLPVSNAKIVLLHLPTNSVFKATSNKSGEFSFENLPVGGPYKISVTADNFKAYENSTVQLSLGDNDIPNILLESNDSVLQEVVVTGKNATKAGAGSNFGQKQINSLPNISRGIQDVTKLTPQSSNNSFAGTNFRYNNVTIDGSINNDAIGFSPSLGGQSGTSGMPGSSTRSNSISLDAIQDIQVYIAPYDVKLGNFLGGSVNAVTRSGSNKVTGSVYTYGRNGSITGRNNAGDGSKIPATFGDFQNGFRVGFPIVKDKLFFFTNGEIAERNDPLFYNGGDQGSLIDATTAQTLTDFVKTKYGFDLGTYDAYTNYAKSKKIFNKIDWKINANNSLSVRNNIVFSEASNLERDAANFRFSSIDYIQKNVSNSTVLEFKSHFGLNFSNDLVVGYSTIKDYREPKSGNILFPQVEIGYNGGTLLFGNDREATVFNMKQNTTEITDNLTYKSGNHTFLLGTHNEFYDINYGFVNSLNGRVAYSSLNNFYNGLPSRVRGSYANDGASRDDIFNNPYAKFKVNLYSAYLQDEIKVGSKLKITPGVRIDYTDMPSKPQLSNQAISSPQDPNYGTTYAYTPVSQIKNNFFGSALISPRFGFSYDVNGDKSVIIRGGSGIFTGRIPFAWLGYAFYNDGVGYGSYDVKPTASSNIGDPLAQGGQTYAFANGQANRTQIDLIDNKFKMPQISRNSLAVDFTIKGYKVTFEGIYTKVIRDLKFQQINLEDKVSYFTYDVNHEMPIYSGNKINNNLSNAYLLSNTNQGYRYSLTAQVSKTYNFGLNFMVAYTFGQSKDITNGIRNSMESNWQLNQSLTPNDPKLAYSNFDVKHRFVSNLGYAINLTKNNTLSANVYFNAQSGNTFTWGYVNSTIANDPQAAGLAFIPKDYAQTLSFMKDITGAGGVIIKSAAQQATEYEQFIQSNDYLSSRRGQFTERNGDRTPWNIQADMRVMDEFKFKVKNSIHSIQISFSVINVGNLLNKDWGRSYFVPNTFNSTASLGLTKVGNVAAGNPNAGDPLYNYSTPKTKPYTVDQFASRFQGQLGFRYSF
ncbi:MAG: TonB-dependent receptor [Flavobacterium sp.]|nr:TonB-dependent receptor [Flavobacterium sp.]